MTVPIIIPLLDKAIEEQKEDGPYLGVFKEMKTFLGALRDKAEQMLQKQSTSN